MWILFWLGVAYACEIRPGPFYDCRQNNLTKFELPAVPIWKADFSNNNVGELQARTFEDRDVSIFVFSGIRIIRTSAFINLPSTTIIYILNGQLTLIEPNAFAAMPRFVHMYISHNNPIISCIPWQDIFGMQILEVTLYTALQTISTRTNKTECGIASSSSAGTGSGWSLMFILICMAVGTVVVIGGIIYVRRASVILPELPKPQESLYDETPPIYLDVADSLPGSVLYETADDYTIAETGNGHFSECPLYTLPRKVPLIE